MLYNNKVLVRFLLSEFLIGLNPCFGLTPFSNKSSVTQCLLLNPAMWQDKLTAYFFPRTNNFSPNFFPDISGKIQKEVMYVYMFNDVVFLEYHILVCTAWFGRVSHTCVYCMVWFRLLLWVTFSLAYCQSCMYTCVYSKTLPSFCINK